MIRIAIPTDEGRLFGHFGQARDFTVFEADPDSREVVRIETLEAQPHGSCGGLISQLSEEKINVVIVGGIGGGAAGHLGAAGIEIFAGTESEEVTLLAKQYLAGELVHGEANCSAHGHGHGGGRCH